MNKDKVNELKQFCEQKAFNYSRADRDGNLNAETFKVYKIIPTSEDTASLIMEKSSGKRAFFFCYYINRGMMKGWQYFVPTDSHILGMRFIEKHKSEIEEYNYSKNL